MESSQLTAEFNRVIRWLRMSVASGMRETKSWSEFVERFSLPKSGDWAAFERRVYANLWYWRSNYVCIALLMFIWTLYSTPRLLFALLVLIPLWVSLLTTTSARMKITPSFIITQQQGIIALGCITVFLIYWMNLVFALLFIVASSASLIVLHASLRPANIKATASKGFADLRFSLGGGSKNTNSDGSGSSNSSSNNISGAAMDPEAAASPFSQQQQQQYTREREDLEGSQYHQQQYQQPYRQQQLQQQQQQQTYGGDGLGTMRARTGGGGKDMMPTYPPLEPQQQQQYQQQQQQYQQQPHPYANNAMGQGIAGASMNRGVMQYPVPAPAAIGLTRAKQSVD